MHLVMVIILQLRTPGTFTAQRFNQIGNIRAGEYFLIYKKY